MKRLRGVPAYVNMMQVHRLCRSAALSLVGTLMLGCDAPRFQSAPPNATESSGGDTEMAAHTASSEGGAATRDGTASQDGTASGSDSPPSSGAEAGGDSLPQPSPDAGSAPEPRPSTSPSEVMTEVPFPTSGPSPGDTSTPRSEVGSGSSHGETSASASIEVDPPFEDECPGHDQTERGWCGCGHIADPLCQALSEALAHRYSFALPPDQPAPEVVHDSVGAAALELFQAEVDHDGSVILNGEGAFLSLPPGTLSKLTEATLDIWVRWWGGSDNQRILNFGAAPDDGDAPDNYLSISPRGSNDVLSVQYRTDPDERGERLDADFALPTDSIQHLTLVVSVDKLTLYANGELAESASTRHRLEDLDDDANWLGRALYADYPNLGAAFYEFRIYGRALSGEEVRTSHAVGLDLPGTPAP